MSKGGPRFSEKEKLAIVKEGEKTGVKAVCAKYGCSERAYRIWTCTAYGIYLSDYYRWKQKFQFQKSPRRSFSEQERLQIIKDAIRDGITKTSDKLPAAAALTFRRQHAPASVYELASKDCKAIPCSPDMAVLLPHAPSEAH